MAKNRLERAIQCSAWQRDWQLANANQTSCSRSMRNRRHESSFPQLRGIKILLLFSHASLHSVHERRIHVYANTLLFPRIRFTPPRYFLSFSYFTINLNWRKKKKRKSNPQNYLTKTIFFSSKTFSSQRKKSYDSLNAWRDCNNQINKFFLLAFSSPITRQNLRSR